VLSTEYRAALPLTVVYGTNPAEKSSTNAAAEISADRLRTMICADTSQSPPGTATRLTLPPTNLHAHGSAPPRPTSGIVNQSAPPRKSLLNQSRQTCICAPL
jgi:hypothetical protein